MLRAVENTRKKRRPWLIAGSILVALLAIVGILTLLALNDPGRNDTPASPDTGTVLTKLGAAALEKQPAQISQQELNGLLSARFKTMPPQCKINSDKTVELYIPVNYKGIRIGLTVSGNAAFSPSRQQMVFQLHSVTVGRLPVPPTFALRLAKDRLPEGFTAEGDLLYADISLLMGGDFSSITGVQITGMDFFNGNLAISVAGDPNKFKEFIVQSLPNLLKIFK